MQQQYIGVTDIPAQVEIQVQPETKTITLDTIELFDVRSTTTDTDQLIMYDNGSTQTSLFDPVLVNTPVRLKYICVTVIHYALHTA